MLLLNQNLLSCTCNITRTMRTITELITNKSALTRSIYGTIALDSIESKMLVNKLNKKEMETFSQKQISKSNKPMFDQRSCII